MINLVQDQIGSTSYTVETKGLSYVPPVLGATYNQSLITALPGFPAVSSNHGTTTTTDNATITNMQASNTTFNSVSNVPDTGDFTFSTIGWGYFDAANLFVGTAATLGNSVILALNGTAGRILKVEFVSTSNPNTRRFFYVTLGANPQNFTFDLTGFGTVAMINFVADQVGSTNYTVETKGLSVPIPTFAADPALTVANVSHVAGVLNLVSFASEAPSNPQAAAGLHQISSTRFNVQYDVRNAESFAGSITAFDYFSTPSVVESVNLSGLSSFVLGLRFQLGQGNVILEFQDASVPSQKFQVILSGVSTTEQFYSIPTSVFSSHGVDLLHIANINLVLVSEQITSKEGTLEVNFGDHPVNAVSTVVGVAYNPSAITTLPGAPALTSGSGNTRDGHPAAGMTLVQPNSSEFSYEYDLSPDSTSFTFARIANGDFVGGVFQGTTMSLPQQLTFALQGSAGGRVKVQIRDYRGRGGEFILELQPYMQNFVLNLVSPNVSRLFDRTQVAEIVFVQDLSIGSVSLNDFVRVQTQNLDYTGTFLPANLTEIQTNLTQESLGYFTVGGVGIDPVTHFPYDNLTDADKHTQPTLIGFYFQILGDMVRGNMPLPNGWTNKNQALAEIQTVLTNLLSAQSAYGWNGLMPWLNLGPLGRHENKVALGDNANLAQSLAVMVGALEDSGLSGTDLTSAQQIIAKVDQFLNAQAPGYAAFVDPSNGLFHGDYTWTTNPQTGYFSFHIDRLANEFRGAVAFLKVRFPSLPRTVWDNLVITTNNTYVTRTGESVTNLAAWDGGAFQIFWPSLRNNERDFIGFRNALYNQLVTQLDFSFQNRIPGILSASQDTNGFYQGNVGIPQISEHNMSYSNNIVMDLGSTYALASAMNIDIYTVLGWLDSIDYLYGMNGPYGFFDSARSASEVAPSYIGIDVASTLLGLSGNGPGDFTTYLRNRSLESGYNALYDQKSALLANINRATTGLPTNAPEFPNRSLAVFSHIASEGPINNVHTVPSIPAETTPVYGVRLAYNNLAGLDSGHYWNFNQVYDATANQLILQYSAVDSPQRVRIELKDAAGLLIYQTTVTLQQGASYARLSIDLPNLAALANVKELDLVVDPQEGGDATGDFTIHAIDFQHLPSAPALAPGSNGASGSLVVPTHAVVEPQPISEIVASPTLVTSNGTSGSPAVAVPDVALPTTATSAVDVTSGSSAGAVMVSPVNNVQAQSAVAPQAISGVVVPAIAPLLVAETGSPAVSVLPANDESVRGVVQLESSSSRSTLQHATGSRVYRNYFNLKAANSFSEIVLNFDPRKNGSTADLSAAPKLVFGIRSKRAKRIKLRIEDRFGNSYSSSDVDLVGSNYYKFLTSVVADRVDLKHIKTIRLGVDQYSVESVKEGDLQLEVGGLS